jgi:hyaluronoglucosaminidase
VNRLCRLAPIVLLSVFGLAASTHADPYAYRGVIFGPYGRPWSHTDRMDVLAWMGAHGMNFYVHAAKDDVYQRLQWRDPYPDDVFAAFAEELGVAHAAGVEWVPNVSPGVPLIPSVAAPTGVPSRDICFSCPDDLEVLVAKLAGFYALGVRTFMVSFDDVQKLSTHPEDLLAFGVGDDAYGRMTASLLNAVAHHPTLAGSTILTVPADYSGTAPTAYLTAFGPALDRAVRVMWTGTAVVSHEIRGEDAASFRRALFGDDPAAPKLLVWDNFPVNDYNGNIFSSTGLDTGFKLNVGPYKGRQADLVEQIDGVLANPMNEAQASKIPLYTVAAYLNDPTAYVDDPTSCPYDSDITTNDVAGCLAEAAWRAGIADFGGSLAVPLLDFVNQMRSTPMDRTESPVFVARWHTLGATYPGAFWKEAWSALVTELDAEGAAGPALRAAFSNSGFLAETRNHLAELDRNVTAGMLGAEMLAAERPSLAIVKVEDAGGGMVRVTGSVRPADPLLVASLDAELDPLEIERRSSPYSVHGDRLQQDLANVYVNENRMDAFLGFVHLTSAAWAPLAPLAARGPLSVTVNGVPAAVAADGSFNGVAPTSGSIEVVATDAAGGSTGERVMPP